MSRRLLVVALLIVAFTLPTGALADGGPTPGVLFGGDGAAAPGDATRYVAVPAGRSTVISAIETGGGRVTRFRSLRGSYGVPVVAFDGTTAGLSADGRTLVLASPGRPARFAFLDPATLRLRRLVTLRGTFAFDAVSPDASMLYVIELVAPARSNRYLVRAYDVERGRLLARPVRDPRDDERTMHGYPIARAASSGGQRVYTLYTSDEGHVFVHALDTRSAKARCIDLPWRGGRDASWALELALSKDERRLVASDERGEPFAVVDTTTFRVEDVSAVEAPSSAAQQPQRADRKERQAGAFGGALGSLALVLAGATLAVRRRLRARR